MLYETASVTTDIFYNFIFIKMKGPNKLLKLKLKKVFHSEELFMDWFERTTTNYAQQIIFSIIKR